MSSTNKTPNYNLSQFVDSDKPSWRGDYNSDMSKIDTGIKSACIEAQAAATIATDAKSGVQQLDTRVDTVETTATSALSLAQSNETNLGATEAELTQHKAQASSQVNTINSQISAINANITSVETRLNGKKDIVPDGWQVGSHVRLIHPEDAHDRTFVPGGDGIQMTFTETGGNGLGKWCTMASDQEPRLTQGTYMITLNAYMQHLSTATRTWRFYLGYKKDGQEMTYSRYASTCTWSVPGASGTNPDHWGTLTYVVEFDEPTELSAFVQLPIAGSGGNATGRMGQCALYITRLNDGTGATRDN